MPTEAIIALPYRTTHADYSDHVGNLSRVSKLLQGTHVQVQSRGVTLCGQVCDLQRFARSANDWFKVRTAIATGWFPSERVRLCSGLPDQLCSCEAVSTVVTPECFL